MKDIIIVKPGAISPEGLGELKKNDIIVIEADSPDDIKVLDTFSLAHRSVIDIAFWDALNQATDSAKVRFCNSILKSVKPQ